MVYIFLSESSSVHTLRIELKNRVRKRLQISVHCPVKVRHVHSVIVIVLVPPVGLMSETTGGLMRKRGEVCVGRGTVKDLVRGDGG